MFSAYTPLENVTYTVMSSPCFREREKRWYTLPALTVSHIREQYQAKNGETLALRDVTFTVETGEFVSIVGPSGCGKSTLLSIIAGLLKPTSGQVLVNETVVSGISPHVGYMLQKDNLLSWRTIYKNVLFGLEIQNRLTPESVDRADRLLKTYGLWDFRHNYPHQLSGGWDRHIDYHLYLRCQRCKEIGRNLLS